MAAAVFNPDRQRSKLTSSICCPRYRLLLSWWFSLLNLPRQSSWCCSLNSTPDISNLDLCISSLNTAANHSSFDCLLPEKSFWVFLIVSLLCSYLSRFLLPWLGLLTCPFHLISHPPLCWYTLFYPAHPRLFTFLWVHHACSLLL